MNYKGTYTVDELKNMGYVGLSGNDDAHKVYGLGGGLEAHSFVNGAGTPYCAIYSDKREMASCPAEDEDCLVERAVFRMKPRQNRRRRAGVMGSTKYVAEKMREYSKREFCDTRGLYGSGLRRRLFDACVELMGEILDDENSEAQCLYYWMTFGNNISHLTALALEKDNEENNFMCKEAKSECPYKVMEYIMRREIHMREELREILKEGESEEHEKE